MMNMNFLSNQCLVTRLYSRSLKPVIPHFKCKNVSYNTLPSLVAMHGELPLRAQTDGCGFFVALPGPPFHRRGWGSPFLPSTDGADSCGMAWACLVQMWTMCWASICHCEAAFGCWASPRSPLDAQRTTKQCQELLADAAVHVPIDIWVQAALQEEENEWQRGQPGGYGGARADGHRAQHAVGPHPQDVRCHDHKHHTCRLAVVVEAPVPSVPDRIHGWERTFRLGMLLLLLSLGTWAGHLKGEVGRVV